VLALVAESPRHGFAIARLLGPDGEVGAIWTLPRPLVYRALEILEADGLIEARATEQDKGPRRTVLAVTRRGRQAARRWLDTPVEHVRDARSELMLKLLFLERSGRDREPLLRAQLEQLGPLEASLRKRVARAEGFERTLALWRLESTRALLRVIRTLLAER
jgi:DNA-binding PadR family transcriptional regulator